MIPTSKTHTKHKMFRQRLHIVLVSVYLVSYVGYTGLWVWVYLCIAYLGENYICVRLNEHVLATSIWLSFSDPRTSDTFQVSTVPDVMLTTFKVVRTSSHFLSFDCCDFSSHTLYGSEFGRPPLWTHSCLQTILKQFVIFQWQLTLELCCPFGVSENQRVPTFKISWHVILFFCLRLRGGEGLFCTIGNK